MKNALKSWWVAAAVLAGCSVASAQSTVTVYSARNEPLIKPLFDQFTKETGVAVRVLTDKEGALLARLKAEGANTPADVLITVDAGNLWQAAHEDLLKPVKSQLLTTNVPAHLRDPDGLWFGLSVRARTIMFNPKAVQRSALSTYEDLADPKWKGKLCLRTSKKVYNQSLVAMLIQELGEAKTEAVVRGWVANLATDVFSDDTALLKAIAAGQCQVGIANTYYLGRLIVQDRSFPVEIFWANQAAGGTHVNISGAGVTKYAKNEAAALQLIEFLSNETAQKIYADQDLEYPVNPRVKADSIIKAWGDFKPSPLNVSKAGELQSVATRLMDRAGYR